MSPPAPFTAKDFTIVKRDGVYHLFYIRNNSTLSFDQTQKDFGHATSVDLYFWTQRDSVLPVRPGFFDNSHVWAPSIVERDGVYYMFYTGVADSPGVHALDQRIGVATSSDLYQWNRLDAPVLRCLDVPWTWCDSLSSTPFRDPMVAADSLSPNLWWMVYATAAEGTPSSMVAGLATSDGDFERWQDQGPIGVTSRTITYSDLMESPHLFHHNGLWFLFWTTNSIQPLGWATTPDPLTPSSEWTWRGHLNTMLGYDTSSWFASEYLQDGLVDYFLFVNGDRVEVDKMNWLAADRFSLVQPDLFHVQSLTWGWGSVSVGGSVTLFIQSKWWSGRSIPIESFWIDSLDVWHPVANSVLGLPDQIPLDADLTAYTWTAQALPDSLGAPLVPRVVVRLTDQTATSNEIELLPAVNGEPDPQPWPGDPNGTGGDLSGVSADNPRLRTLSAGIFGSLPSVVVDFDQPIPARLDVFDLQGRRVRNLADRTMPAGATVFAWDGHDASGRRLRAGIYFVRLATPEGVYTSRILLR